MAYRTSRNLTASIVDFITAQLITDEWQGITVIKGNSKVYDTVPPVITVRLSDTDHLPIQIGDNSTTRETLLFLDIYGSNNGIGLVEDIKEWLVSIIKNGIIYYEYVITNGVVFSKTNIGKISFLNIKDSPINFDTPKNELDVRDRWRWLVTATIETRIIET